MSLKGNFVLLFFCVILIILFVFCPPFEKEKITLTDKQYIENLEEPLKSEFLSIENEEKRDKIFKILIIKKINVDLPSFESSQNKDLNNEDKIVKSIKLLKDFSTKELDLIINSAS